MMGVYEQSKVSVKTNVAQDNSIPLPGLKDSIPIHIKGMVFIL